MFGRFADYEHGNFFLFLSVYYHIKRLHIKFGCSRAVLKFGGWQLKKLKRQALLKILASTWKISAQVHGLF